MTPDGWRRATLGDVVACDGLQTGPFGSQLHSFDYVADGVPVVMPKDILERGFNDETVARVSPDRAASLERHRLRLGDIVFSRRGDLGRLGRVTETEAGWLCGTGCLRARLGKNVVPEYVLHALRSQESVQWLTSNAVGQTMPNLNTAILSRIPLLVPPLAEQRRIAAVLSAVDEAIEKTDAVAQQLANVRLAVMSNRLSRGEWDRRRGSATKPALPEVLLDEVAVRGSGHTPDKKHPEYWNGGIPWVSLRDSSTLDRVYIHETVAEISEQGIANSSAVLHPFGTVVLTRDAGVGKSAILAKAMAVSQHFMAWRCGPRLDRHFLYYWLQHMKPVFEAIASGNTIKTIGLPFFKALKIPLPDLHEQQQTAKLLLALDEALASNERRIDAVRDLKRNMASALLSGRVRVPPAAKAA